MTKQIYFASPLFSEMEKMYNAHAVEKIRAAYSEWTVFVPQEQGEINDKNAYADAKTIAQYDTDALLKSGLVVAVLDGVSIDVGVATEIGIAYQAGIPVIGLYTDSRQQGATNQKKLDALQDIAESQFAYINLYTAGIVKLNGVIVNSLDDVLVEIGKR